LTTLVALSTLSALSALIALVGLTPWLPWPPDWLPLLNWFLPSGLLLLPWLLAM
jgi:hypothetical protein